MLPAIFDYLCYALHTALVLFILLGWTVRPWRSLHRVVVLVTLFYWFGLGWWYGWGYCPLTEWHWQIRKARGIHDLPTSYLYDVLVLRMGLPLSPRAVDILAVLGLLISTAMAFSPHFALRSGVHKEQNKPGRD
jgi:hypothetical protein